MKDDHGRRLVQKAERRRLDGQRVLAGKPRIAQRQAPERVLRHIRHMQSGRARWGEWDAVWPGHTTLSP